MGGTAGGLDPKGPFPRARPGLTITAMQVIASERPVPGLPSRFDIVRALVVGGFLVAGASVLGYLVFATTFLGQFTPIGRPTTTQLVAGALAWTFALTAPAGFGLVGLVRLASAFERMAARRPKPTPAARLAKSINDDHAVASRVRLPDGSRILPELIIGPFGAAV